MAILCMTGALRAMVTIRYVHVIPSIRLLRGRLLLKLDKLVGRLVVHDLALGIALNDADGGAEPRGPCLNVGGRGRD
jgi:hypothetical protein